MKEKWFSLKPEEIEKESFCLIRKELAEQGISLPEEIEPVVVRVIHTTADFEYAKTLVFSDHAVERAREAVRGGAHIITDTNMALSGIRRSVVEGFGGSVRCFMAEEETAKEAAERGVTRAYVSMEKAAALGLPLIFAVGNAPTALICLKELMDQGFEPKLIIAVPVGFVNVVEAKELILESHVPCIVNRGRKGGSTVAAAICNSILCGM